MAVFFIGKGCQFIIPIILGNFLKPEEYGLIEFSMSIGLLTVSVVSMGSNAFISRAIVKKERWIKLNDVKLYLLLISSVLTLFFLFLHLINSLEILKYSLAFSAVLLLQGGLSVELKSRAKRESAMILDIILWLAILLGVLLYYFKLVSGLFNALLLIILSYYTILAISFLRSIQFKDFSFNLVSSLYFLEGPKIVIISLIGTLVATAGQLIIGNSFGISAVGEYSSLYRIAIFPIIIHQIIMIYFYRTSFSPSREQFLLLANTVFLIVLLVSLISWTIADFLTPFLGSAFAMSYKTYPVAFTAMMISIPFWSATSVNEIAYSQKVSSIYPVLSSIIYLIAIYVVTTFFVDFDSLENAAIFISLVIIGYYLINSLCLISAGVKIAKIPIIFGIGFAVTELYVFLVF